MNENTLPEDPIGPPLLGRTAPPGTARSQALTGHHTRQDGLGPLTTWPTIGTQSGDS
jgi:hypothetical protein